MTGHLRLYWIRTSCKRYKYERHFYGKIISVHSFLEDINEIIHEADSRMYEEKALYEASEGLVHFTQLLILPF